MRKPFPVEEYRRAVEQENEARDIAFLDVPEVVCGKPVRAMTVQDVIMLDGLASPFVCGGESLEPKDVVMFLWYLNPKRTGSRLAQWRFSFSCRNLKFIESVLEVQEFVARMFMDAPASGDQTERLSYYSWAASLVDKFASEYGWSDEKTLTTPLPRLFQLMKAMAKRNNPKTILRNNRSWKIRQQWLEEIGQPEQN